MSILAYIAICLLVGLLGSKRKLGFALTFVLSFILTPIVTLILLLITKEKKA